jgi:outer membrane protein W
LRRLACLAGATLAAAVLLPAIGGPAPAAADVPRITAGMSYGIGGLFDEEYIADVKRASEMGHFSAGVFGVDVAFVFPSHLVAGVRVHSLRVPVGNSTDAGRLDLVPATLYVGYRRPALAGRIHGFVGAGFGIASARFAPAATIGHWQPWEGESEIDVSEDSPLVFEVTAGADVALSEDFSVDLTFASTFVDTEVAFRPLPVQGLAAEEAYRVKGRHLSLSLGLRWWVELW